MASKTDFSEQEWDQLRKGATGAGMLVAVSDRSFLDSFKEAGLAREASREQPVRRQRADPRALERARNGVRPDHLAAGDRIGDARGSCGRRSRRSSRRRPLTSRPTRRSCSSSRRASARRPAAATKPRRRRSRRSGPRSAPSRPPEAVQDVVVDQPGRLHERVAGGRADEAEAAPLQLLAHRRRLGGLRRDLADRAKRVHARLAVDERPEQLAERHVERERRPGVPDHGLDLAAVADDAGVAEQPLDVAFAEAGDRLDVPAGERGAVALALVQDRRPGEPGLRALEVQQLEELSLVPFGNAPFLVVVGDVERIVRAAPRRSGSREHGPRLGRLAAPAAASRRRRASARAAARPRARGRARGGRTARGRCRRAAPSTPRARRGARSVRARRAGRRGSRGAARRGASRGPAAGRRRAARPGRGRRGRARAAAAACRARGRSPPSRNSSAAASSRAARAGSPSCAAATRRRAASEGCGRTACRGCR